MLPSPNGSAISFAIQNSQVICGSLRNARAVAHVAKDSARKILVLAAGEQWEAGILRPSLEDIIGAGAILAELSGKRSPEAEWALGTFKSFENDIGTTIRNCASGRELIERGFPEDVAYAAALNASEIVPILKDGYFSSLARMAR